MFPSYDDFGVAAFFSFMAYTENPGLTAEFRVVQLSEESTIVSYGFKQRPDDEIRKFALAYRDARAHQSDVAPIELSQKLLGYNITWRKIPLTSISSMRVRWILSGETQKSVIRIQNISCGPVTASSCTTVRNNVCSRNSRLLALPRQNISTNA